MKTVMDEIMIKEFANVYRWQHVIMVKEIGVITSLHEILRRSCQRVKKIHSGDLKRPFHSCPTAIKISEVELT